MLEFATSINLEVTPTGRTRTVQCGAERDYWQAGEVLPATGGPLLTRDVDDRPFVGTNHHLLD